MQSLGVYTYQQITMITAVTIPLAIKNISSANVIPTSDLTGFAATVSSSTHIIND